MNKRNEANLRTGNVIQDDWEQQIVDTFEQGRILYDALDVN